MLEWAGQSVMMGNAAPDLRAMAKTRGWKLTLPNDEDGVAVMLEAAVTHWGQMNGRKKHWASTARS
jgi:hydroxymethylpyrimidine pyrophosphatase-like HAD family hydrolase